MNIVVRGIRGEDIETLCGRKANYSLIGKTIELNGEPVCVAGVFFKEGKAYAFSDIKRGMCVPKRTIWRYGNELKKFILSLNMDIEATANKDFPRSGKFLRSLGFKYVGIINNEETYRLNTWQ